MPELPPNQPSPDGSDQPGRSDEPGRERPRRLRPSGGYRKLRSYQVATLIYDGTVSFCDRFVDKRSRTHDQMVQAARSGGKNIAEGSRAAATTSQTELRLVKVARASLEELLLDYLLDQQISALERDFVQEGGYSEQLAAARIAERQKQQQRPGAPTPAAPACPRCGKPMALRTARKGERAGSQFWGCSGFPECKGTRALEASDGSDRSRRGSA